jgi:hypothetical protein
VFLWWSGERFTSVPILTFKLQEKPSRTIESIGAFQKLPVVMPSIDILGSALRKARRVSATKGSWLLFFNPK